MALTAVLSAILLVQGCSRARPSGVGTDGTAGTTPTPAQTGAQTPDTQTSNPQPSNGQPSTQPAGASLWLVGQDGRKEAAGTLPVPALGGSLSPDGTWLAVLRPTFSRPTETFRQYDAEVEVIGLGTGERWSTGVNVADSFRLSWAANSRYLAIEKDPNVCIADIGARGVTCLSDTVSAAAWSPDSQRLALLEQAPGAGAKDPLDLVFLTWPEKNEQRFKGLASVVTSMGIGRGSLTYAPDGSRVALSSRDDVLIVDAAKGQTLTRFASVFRNRVRTLSWSPNGQWLAAAYQLIDISAKSMKPIPLPEQPKGRPALGPTRIVWSPESSSLVAQDLEEYPDAFSWAWSAPAKQAGAFGAAGLAPLGFRPDGRLLAVEQSNSK